MSKIILTGKEFSKWNVTDDRSSIKVTFKGNFDLNPIIKFGFTVIKKYNTLSIEDIIPFVGFNMNPTKLEFRSKLREGLFITCEPVNKNATIIFEKADGKMREVFLKERKN